MEYEVVITKREPNPEYRPPRPLYDHYSEMEKNTPFLTRGVLSTVLSEEQFNAIRKACLEQM